MQEKLEIQYIATAKAAELVERQGIPWPFLRQITVFPVFREMKNAVAELLKVPMTEEHTEHGRCPQRE